MYADRSMKEVTEVKRLCDLYLASQKLLTQQYETYEEDETLVSLRDQLVNEQEVLIAKISNTPSKSFRDILSKLEIWATAEETLSQDAGPFALSLTQMALTAYAELKANLSEADLIGEIAA